MKINFSGTYPDLRRLIDAPVKPSNGQGEEFNNLLASISPNKTQTPENTNKIAIEFEPLHETPKDPMARFQFKEPELARPNLRELLSTPSVNEAEESVKEPTLSKPKIIGARRITTSEEKKLSDLSLDERKDRIKELVADAGSKHGIDPALGMAVVSTESAFNPAAISSDGHASKGLFQLLDTTGKNLMERGDVKGRYNPFNPELNVDLGVGYLRYLHDIFSRSTDLPGKLSTVAAANSSSLEKLAVAAFNAGEGRVASAQSRAKAAGADPSTYEAVKPYLPDITQRYVDEVVAKRVSYEE